jgi:hypothetical protein
MTEKLELIALIAVSIKQAAEREIVSYYCLLMSGLANKYLFNGTSPYVPLKCLK